MSQHGYIETNYNLWEGSDTKNDPKITEHIFTQHRNRQVNTNRAQYVSNYGWIMTDMIGLFKKREWELNVINFWYIKALIYRISTKK